MNKIFKMDIHRQLRSPVLYVSIIFITIMAVAVVMSGMSTSIDGLLGVVGSSGGMGADEGADFMASAMGVGVIFILISIVLTLFVCKDYSGGFAKNIFTTHSNPWNYIGGKMMSMAVLSGFLLVLYTIESIVSLVIFGGSLALTGGILGLIVFLIEKWLLSLALSAVILLVVLFTRNIALGVLAGFLIATGGLSMGAALFGQMLGIGWLSTIFSVTISGTSQLCTLSFDPLTFIRVLITSVAWIGIGCFLSRRVLLKKDI